MIKKLIALFILLVLLLTACSATSEDPLSDVNASDAEVGDAQEMKDDMDNLYNDTQTSEESKLTDGERNEDDETQAVDELTNGEDSPDTNRENDQSQLESSQHSDEPQTQTAEPTYSEANEPTETEEPPVVFEEYLAALTLYALSMEYPDFELGGIYSTHPQFIESNPESGGIYAAFTSGGSDLVAYVYPIVDERAESGTMDIYANELGFAAFELIDEFDASCAEIPQDIYVSLLPVLSGISVFLH